MNKNIYITGLTLLLIAIATPFIIDFFNPWPSVKRLGVVMIISGLVFSSSLAFFWKKKEEQSF